MQRDGRDASLMEGCGWCSIAVVGVEVYASMVWSGREFSSSWLVQ